MRSGNLLGLAIALFTPSFAVAQGGPPPVQLIPHTADGIDTFRSVGRVSVFTGPTALEDQPGARKVEMDVARLVNIPSTNAALTTLVTKKINDRPRDVPFNRLARGKRSNKAKRAVLTSSRTNLTIPP